MTDTWTYESRPLLFEIRMPVDGKMMLIERTPDENAARMAFDAARAVLSFLKPRPKANLELYYGPTVLDVFNQTKEGDESEPMSS